MKTAVYVRVSTEEQVKEGYSIRAQIDKLKDYIRIKDWELYKVYADEGISGKNLQDRPAINELIADIKQGHVNNVLVFKIDRLTRSTRDLLDLTDLFNNHGCNFNSVTESIDTQTASGRMFLKIIGIFAEFERENISERSKLGFEKKAKEGYTLNSHIQSYGYDRENGDKIQKINQEEAKVVREIFEMYTEGNMSHVAIGKNLNYRKIKPKVGEIWNHSSVRNILNNPNYIGKVRYSVNDKARYFEADGKHEPIISEELFLKAQTRKSKMEHKAYTKRPKNSNYFCGTIYCGTCGAKLYTHTTFNKVKTGEKNDHGQYFCPNVKKGLCNSTIFTHNKTDVAFQEYIKNINDISAINGIDLEVKTNRDNVNALLRAECENAISKFEKKEKDVMTLYINEQIGFKEYSQMYGIITAEKEKHVEMRNNVPSEQENETVLTSMDIITNIRENWLLLTNAEKLQFAQEYIEKITAVSIRQENKKRNTVKILKVEFYND